MKEELLLLRNQLKMGYRISFADAMLLQRAIDILVNKAGNFPAQSDCCPAQNHVSPEQNSVAPAQSPIDHGYRPECECPWCKATARICAELSVNSPAIPDGYVMVPKEMTDEIGEAIAMQANCCGGIALDIYDAMLAAAPQSPGSEPATVPGKWIPVSEQMPEVGDIVLTAMGGVVNVGETECSAANCRFFTSVISGRELPATHWMQLPAAPQEVGDA